MSSQSSIWLNGVLGQVIEGASDAFLIVAGGSAAISATSVNVPTADLKHIGVSMAFGAAIYAASYLKKNPTPSTIVLPAAAAPAPVVVPPA